MQIKTHKSHKKIFHLLLTVTAIIIAIVVAYLVYAMFIKPSPSLDSSKNKQSSSASEDPKSSSEPIKSVDSKTTPPNTDQTPNPQTDATTGMKIIPVVASSKVDGNVVYIRGGLNVIRKTGECYVSLVGPGGEKIQKNTTLLPSAGTTDCKTVSIPTSELTAGKWVFTLIYSADDAMGESSVQSFLIS